MNEKIHALRQMTESLIPTHVEQLQGTPTEKARLAVEIAILDELEQMNETLAKIAAK